MANSTKHKIRSKRSYHNYKAFDMFSRNAEVTAIKRTKFNNSNSESK